MLNDRQRSAPHPPPSTPPHHKPNPFKLTNIRPVHGLELFYHRAEQSVRTVIWQQVKPEPACAAEQVEGRQPETKRGWEVGLRMIQTRGWKKKKEKKKEKADRR